MTIDTTSRLTLIAPPEDEALMLAEAKQFLRIEHTTDDAVIERAIVAARHAAEEYLRVVLLEQTYSYEFTQVSHILPLPVGPAQSIAHIYAYTSEGASSTINAANYRLTIDGFGVVFPHIPAVNSFAVEFTAWLVDVPAPVKQGMLHHIAAMLEQRGGSGAIPAQSRQLYQPYRRVRF